MDSFCYRPKVAFRGTRNYFHSTDLYEEILVGAREAGLEISGPLVLKIRARITHQPVLMYEHKNHDAASPAATCSFVGNSEPWLVLISESDQAITDYKPYDERIIWSESRIEERSIVINCETNSRPIEVITALGVRIHQVFLPPPPNQRWYLTRLELTRPLAGTDARDAVVSLDKRLGDFTTRLGIVASGERIGSMVFMLR